MYWPLFLLPPIALIECKVLPEEGSSLRETSASTSLISSLSLSAEGADRSILARNARSNAVLDPVGSALNLVRVSLSSFAALSSADIFSRAIVNLLLGSTFGLAGGVGTKALAVNEAAPGLKLGTVATDEGVNEVAPAALNEAAPGLKVVAVGLKLEEPALKLFAGALEACAWLG